MAAANSSLFTLHSSLTTDTISARESLPADEGEILFTNIDLTPKKSLRPQTPYQVLRMLPRDATPAQQDSAIQAWFQPGEIHYSSQPDTLHLPGHGVGRNLKEVNLPQYYRESFFSKDSLLHPELNAGRYGMAGNPVPYALRNDDIITSLLLLCFFLAIIAFANSMRFIGRQLKDFFYTSHSEGSMTETSTELRFQFFFVLQTILLLAVSYFFYVTHYVAETFILQSEYQLLGIIFGAVTAYFVIKVGIYTLVNTVFFDGKKNEHWLKFILFITSLEGILLFPAAMLQVYLDLSVENVAYYLAFVLIFVKILTFYKSWHIFFRQKGFFLQNILYFCALEIIPLLSLWGGLVMIVDQLKVNF